MEKARRVLRHVAGRPLRIEGRIGASPETYLQAAPEKGYALFTAFSGSPTEHTEHIALDIRQVLGVLNHAYTTDSDGVCLDLQFAAPDDTREAFVVGNGNSGIRILSSTGWIDALDISPNSLRIRSGDTTRLHVALPEGAQNVRADVPFETRSDGTLQLRLDAAQQATVSWQ